MYVRGVRFPLVVVALLAAGRVAAADPKSAGAAPAAPPASAASSSEALTRARAAEARARAGDYAGAIVLFKEAFALDGRAEYACNVGVAYYKARDLPRAQLFLDACLLSGADLPQSFVASVWRVLETVEGRLRQGDYAPIDLRIAPADAEVRVSLFADDEPVIGSRRIWLPVGNHTITAAAPGHTKRQFTVEVGSRQAQRIDVVLPAESPPPASQANSKPITDPAPSRPPPLAAPRPAQLNRPLFTPTFEGDEPRKQPSKPVPGLGAAKGTGIAALISLGVSIAFYASAGDSSDDPDDPYDDIDPAAESARMLSYMGFTASAVLGTVSIALFARGAASSNKPTVSASGSSNGGTVWLSGRF